MKPRRSPATKAEKARYEKLKRLPCIACLLKGDLESIGMCGKHEIQHMTAGGRRLGNEFTYPLGAYHHQGHILPGYTGSQMKSAFGPSFAKSRKQFEETFGSEEFLLAETNRLLEGI